MAFKICSATWEKALGIMVFKPWKNPRNTPSRATTNTVGARTLRAIALKGVFSSVPVK